MAWTMSEGRLDARGDLRRAGWVIQLKPGAREEYRRLHENVWPGVQARLRDGGVERYTIFMRDNLLFSYMEYRGDWHDVQSFIEVDEETQRWWKLTEPLQNPLESADVDEWWVRMDEVFNLSGSHEAGGEEKV
jgi:L-rhamnose mutarotase